MIVDTLAKKAIDVDYESIKDNSFSPLENTIYFTSQTNVKELFEGNQSDSSAPISISQVKISFI